LKINKEEKKKMPLFASLASAAADFRRGEFFAGNFACYFRQLRRRLKNPPDSIDSVLTVARRASATSIIIIIIIVVI